jgi:hypothetical protein
VIAGTTAGSIVFGTVSKVVEMLPTTVIGEIALLVVAIVLLRVRLPASPAVLPRSRLSDSPRLAP